MFVYMHENRTEFNIFFLIIHVATFIYIYIYIYNENKRPTQAIWLQIRTEVAITR